MANKELRDKMLIDRLPHWKVADQIGISEPTIYRWLRVEMDDQHKKIVSKAIHDLMDKRKKVSE
ncbi:hypothetical protein WR164_13720 [Philodulcilactobacillus myokoensis]|uniref:Uncharacterized protein n=1 Tax=Philodulcilactobacillus myokoensis TaxID=2929573 RepID=A0A9W6ETQ4_9LACO|nr:helix-turn-helix domain-containing protein [Philodulcilactobacillus myokoensis]GLB47393.1 hypothetical protein WR164_13720 [Philodulcilactobacillus myokoensis]